MDQDSSSDEDDRPSTDVQETTLDDVGSARIGAEKARGVRLSASATGAGVSLRAGTSALSSPASTPARAVLFLPLGNFLVVDEESDDGDDNNTRNENTNTVGVGGHGGAGGKTTFVIHGAERRLIRVNDRIKLVACRGERYGGELEREKKQDRD